MLEHPDAHAPSVLPVEQNPRHLVADGKMSILGEGVADHADVEELRSGVIGPKVDALVAVPAEEIDHVVLELGIIPPSKREGARVSREPEAPHSPVRLIPAGRVSVGASSRLRSPPRCPAANSGWPPSADESADRTCRRA